MTIALALLNRFWPYLLAAILVIAAIVWWNGYIASVQAKGDKIGYGRAAAEYAQKLIVAEENARTLEATWKNQAKQSQEKTDGLLKAKDASYIALSRIADSLRNAATNYGNGLSTDTLAACRNRAATLADVFSESTDALRDMAEAADGQYIDSMNCRDQWPK